MTSKQDKTVGILGGMGPEATIDLFTDIVRQTGAKTDADHLRIIIDNNPKLPSRQDAILKGAENPGPAMAETAQNIEKAGADFIILGANTAHHFYQYVKDAVAIPVLHIIGETVLETKKCVSGINKVGVLATNGSIKSGLFQQGFSEHEIATVEIPEEIQNLVHESIFSFKYDGVTDKNLSMMKQAMDYLTEQGSQAIVMGCTEIPLILAGQSCDVPLINPNAIIAKVSVLYAKNQINVKEVGDKYLSVSAE